MARLMKLFTPDTIVKVLEDNSSNVDAAKVFSKKAGIGISRQLVRYWREIFIEHDGVKARADRALKQQTQLISPSPEDDIGDLSHMPDVARGILLIGDTHEPYVHPDYYDFLEAVSKKYTIDLVVHAGDETDGHALSFHDSDPNLDSAGAELERAKAGLNKLYNLFPDMLLCDSNHGSLIYRRAKAHGLPIQYIKKYRDILFPEHGAPGWSWRSAWKIKTPLGLVLFKHQASGDPLADAAHEGCSIAVGHNHGRFGVHWAASATRLYWAADSGCGIDRGSMAFAYGKHTRNKPMLGCLVVIDGQPISVPMVLDMDGNWIRKVLG